MSRARTLQELAGPTALAHPSMPAVGSAFQPKGVPMRKAVESGGVLLGFQTVRAGDRRSQSWKKRRRLAAYARSNGFRMGQMFVQEEVRGRAGGLGALMRAAAHPQVTAVAVVSETDLGESPRVQAFVTSRLERGARVRVLVVGP